VRDSSLNRENNHANNSRTLTDTAPHLAELAPCRACAVVRQTAGMALVVVMAVVFAGIWAAPNVVRTRVPILAGMGINTSVVLLLAGMALLLPRLRLWLGGLIAAISAAVLGQYFFAWLPPDGFWRIALNVDGRGLPWPWHMSPSPRFPCFARAWRWPPSIGRARCPDRSCRRPRLGSSWRP